MGRACDTLVRQEGGEGKRPLGRPSGSWEHDITMDLQEVG
jgi:hypothetical protein